MSNQTPAPNAGVDRAWKRLQKTKAQELARKRERDAAKPKYNPNASY